MGMSDGTTSSVKRNKAHSPWYEECDGCGIENHTAKLSDSPGRSRIHTALNKLLKIDKNIIGDRNIVYCKDRWDDGTQYPLHMEFSYDLIILETSMKNIVVVTKASDQCDPVWVKELRPMEQSEVIPIATEGSIYRAKASHILATFYDYIMKCVSGGEKSSCTVQYVWRCYEWEAQSVNELFGGNAINTATVVCNTWCQSVPSLLYLTTRRYAKILDDRKKESHGIWTLQETLNGSIEHIRSFYRDNKILLNVRRLIESRLRLVAIEYVPPIGWTIGVTLMGSYYSDHRRLAFEALGFKESENDNPYWNKRIELCDINDRSIGIYYYR